MTDVDGVDMRLGGADWETLVYRSALVLLVLSQFCIHLINASTAAFKEHVDRETSHPNRRGPKIVRVYKLYSRCSNKHVQILGRAINAFGGRDSEHAGLRVETYTFESRVRIQSATSLDYLCFNKNGRLIIRHNGKSNRCVFKEVHTPDDFTEFQSAANPQWYIGFRKNGTPLKGFKWQRRRKRKNRHRQRQRRIRQRQQKKKKQTRPRRERRQTTQQQQQQQVRSRRCYQFIKTDFRYLEHAGGDGGAAASEWGPKGDFSQILKRGMT